MGVRCRAGEKHCISWHTTTKLAVVMCICLSQKCARVKHVGCLPLLCTFFVAKVCTSETCRLFAVVMCICWSTMAGQPVCTARCGCLRIDPARLDLVQFRRRPWYTEYCCLRCCEAHEAQQAPSHGRLCESRCARCGERHDGISVQDHRCGDLTPWERTSFGQLALSDRHRISFY